MDKLEEIKQRLDAARPKYDYLHAAMGSGNHLCTSIVSENKEDGKLDFVCDIWPDYVAENMGDGNRYLDIGFDGHHARMRFYKNVFADMDYLIAELEKTQDAV